MVLKHFSHFLRKPFQLSHSQICVKLKNVFFKRSEHSIFTSSQLQNHFLKSVILQTSKSNRFEDFASHLQKSVLISYLFLQIAKWLKLLFGNAYINRLWPQCRFRGIFCRYSSYRLVVSLFLIYLVSFLKNSLQVWLEKSDQMQKYRFRKFWAFIFCQDNHLNTW